MLHGIDKEYEDPEGCMRGWRAGSWGRWGKEVGENSALKALFLGGVFGWKAHILPDHRPFVEEFSSLLGSKMDDVGGGRQGRTRAEQASEGSKMEFTITPFHSPGPLNSSLLAPSVTKAISLFPTPTSPIPNRILSSSKEQGIIFGYFSPSAPTLAFWYNKYLINIC